MCIMCMYRLLRERMLTACTDVPPDAAGPISYFDRYGGYVYLYPLRYVLYCIIYIWYSLYAYNVLYVSFIYKL